MEVSVSKILADKPVTELDTNLVHHMEIDETAAVLYTSGSTGTRKGVLYRYALK
jgi:long-subunit acyl-CoA synthetase (AMP-forming)